MAMTVCSECQGEVSDRAASCPRCGAPVGVSSPTRGRRKVGALIGVAAVVVLAGVGWTVWGLSSASAHNAAWATHADALGEVSSSSSVVSVAEDHTAVTLTSQGASTCTPAEVQRISAQLISYMVQSGLGNIPASISQPIADRRAATQCADQKDAEFATAVSHTQASLTKFLSAIGAPDSVSSMAAGLRGLDGTQSRTFYTPAVGAVTMQARYDGTNGLAVTLTREPEAVDWGAPFGR